MNTVTEIVPRQDQVIEKLRARIESDPVLKAICKKFASRQRARGQITVTSLKQAMDKDGYSFPKSAYVDALRFLASLNLGRLHKSNNGKIRSLTDIKWTLQSIGQIGLGNNNALLKNFKRPIKYKPLVNQTAKTIVTMGNLTVNLDGKMVSFPLYRQVSKEEIGFILADLYSGTYNKNNNT